MKMEESKNKIFEERKKLDTIVEGRCQAYTVEIERRVINRMNNIVDETASIKEEMLNRLEIFKADQAEVANSI